MSDDPDYRLLLRGAKLRITQPRLSVMSAVSDNPHAETETIIRAARELTPDVSHQTVYDALNALTAVREEFEGAGGGKFEEAQMLINSGIDAGVEVVNRHSGAVGQALELMQNTDVANGNTFTVNGKTISFVTGLPADPASTTDPVTGNVSISLASTGNTVAKGIVLYGYGENQQLLGFQDFGTANRDYGVYIAR